MPGAAGGDAPARWNGFGKAAQSNEQKQEKPPASCRRPFFCPYLCEPLADVYYLPGALPSASAAFSSTLTELMQ